MNMKEISLGFLTDFLILKQSVKIWLWLFKRGIAVYPLNKLFSTVEHKWFAYYFPTDLSAG